MNIETLIPDIYALIKRKQEGWFNEGLSQYLSADISGRLRSQLGERTYKNSLRLSQMGPRCPRALWYSIHRPEEAEPLQPWAEIKFSFGHVIEALALTLARAAGHEVTGEQDELRLDGIVGHRDCVLDGHIVDVKSSSSIGFTKFKSGSFVDTFGYLDQLDCYVMASADDPLVRVKDIAYLFVIDKQLGHMCLYKHEVTDDRRAEIRARIERYKRTIERADPPSCECATIPLGEAGNLQLDLRASYSPYKYSCNPNLRTFLYANGPVYCTRVIKRPFNKQGPITEVDKFGKVVYN